MTEEEKAKAAAEAKAKEEADAKKSKEGEIDYKAELAKYEDKLKKAEFAAIEAKKKAKEGEVDIEGIIQKTTEAVTKQFERKIEETRLNDTKDILEEELEAASSNPDERTLIKTVYETRIAKSGFSRKAIREDLNDARLIVNRPKIEKNMSELRIAATNGVGINRSGTASSHEIEKSTDLSADEEAKVKQIATRTGQSVEKVKAKFLENKRSR